MDRDRGTRTEGQRRGHRDWDKDRKRITVKGSGTQTGTDGHRWKDRDCDRQAYRKYNRTGTDG